MTTRHVLKCDGWTLTYVSHPDRGEVTLLRERDGHSLTDIVMPVVEARQHYQLMILEGFRIVDAEPRCCVCGDPVGEGQATADCCLCLRHCLIASMG